MSETASTASASAPAAASPASEAPQTAQNAADAAQAKSGAADPAASKAEPKLYTVKVDGKSIQMTEEELLRSASLGQAGQKRLQEAAEAKKALESEKAKVNALMAAARSGDYEALTQAGLSEEEIEALSIKFLSAKQQKLLEQERVKALGPEERELEELRRDKADREAKQKAEIESKKAADVAHATKAFTNSVIETLEQFPEQYRRHDAVAQSVVDAWAYVMENEEQFAAKGIQVTPKMVADEVAKEFRGLYRQMVGAAKDEELDEYLPPEVREKVSKLGKAKAEAAAHPSLTAQPQVRDTEKKEPSKPAKRTTLAQAMRKFQGF